MEGVYIYVCFLIKSYIPVFLPFLLPADLSIFPLNPFEINDLTLPMFIFHICDWILRS